MEVKVPMLKINKPELKKQKQKKTSDTLFLHITNALFYKASKNKQQLELRKSPYVGNLSLTKYI